MSKTQGSRKHERGSQSITNTRLTVKLKDLLQIEYSRMVQDGGGGQERKSVHTPWVLLDLVSELLRVLSEKPFLLALLCQLCADAGWHWHSAAVIVTGVVLRELFAPGGLWKDCGKIRVDSGAR